MMYIDQIARFLPHRYPFLLVDRIIEIEAGKRVVGLKNVTVNEEFFQGHYPGNPIMPGVLIIESMAQVGGLLMMQKLEHPEKRLPLLASINKVKFRQPVVPGDSLKIEAEVIKAKGSIAKMFAKGFVEDKLVAEAELMFALEEK